MQLFGIRVFEHQEIPSRRPARRPGQRLRAAAAAMLTLAAGMPPGFAQQTAPTVSDKAASALPAAPAPLLTQPPTLRQSMRNYSKPAGRTWGDPIKWFLPTSIPKASFQNSVRLADLVKDGKIYLSLSDALALALENNYDLAIARYNLDIADTDILRTKTGATPLGAPAGLVTNTLGGASATLTAGGGPGGTSVGAGGAGSGTSGLSLTTQGAGPLPESLEPSVSANIQFDRARQVSTSFFTGGTSSTNTYDFTYDQGFVTGTALQFGFNNTYATTSNPITLFSPQLSSNFKVTLTQHLLRGAGIWVNKRFIYQAINDRRITNSAFRQQILYTVNQVENIYWGLVSAYEDVQAKERALQQSTQLLSDDQKQLQIGTMAPLDVVNADSQVAIDRQALISSQNTLNYQQQIIKQAIARNLNDQALERAPVIPTDRVSIGPLPEESQPLESLVQDAFRNRPELEQAVLTLKNDEITIKGARNALLPNFDLFGYLGGAGIAGAVNPNCSTQFNGTACDSTNSTGWPTASNNAFNNSAPDKGIGFTLTIPLGNKLAQSVQVRSIMEFRQAELHLEQLYTEIRMQVVNAQFALSNERALVQADVAAEQYARQSYDDEVKKLHLGASTTASVLQQERALAIAENNLISAKAGYANARASLYQTLATTLQHYGINMQEAASGNVGAAPLIPGLVPAATGQQEPTTTPPPTQ
ncbi:MAG TPA: TolC family protein [Terracidiphilus sp.]|nr:TolC family protein [Terracidiphilus sp.]